MSSILQILLAVSAGVAFGFPVVGAASVAAPLVNPLLPVGADSWVIHHDGSYFHMHTTAKNLTLWKTRRIGELGNAEKKVVWAPPADSAYSESVWAPEVHHHAGKWYIYFSARGSDRKSHRVWVLENASPDPMAGDWEMKGKLATPSDKWAIDGSVFEFGGRRYFTWSGWEGDTNGEQSIYHANPKAGQGCGKFRSPRAQRFRWRDDGSPDFGLPVPLGTQLTAPAGE